MNNLKELLARVERAEGPDREIDAALWWALQRANAERCYWNGAMGMPKPLPEDLPFERLPGGIGRAGVVVMAPTYTASLDAALALVERCKPGFWWLVRSEDTGGAYGAVGDEKGPGGSKWSEYAATPALAVCAALLQALSDQEGKT